MERAIGLFVTIATLTLFGLLAYYVYHLAESRGWFVTKVEYWTGVNDAAGLEKGDPVTMMGLKVGELAFVERNDPSDYYNLTVGFRVRAPYYGYIWTDSKVKIAGSGMLNHRTLEIVRGVSGVPTVLGTNKTVIALDEKAFKGKEAMYYEKLRDDEMKKLEASSNYEIHHAELHEAASALAAAEINKNRGPYYVPLPSGGHIWLKPDESPDITSRLEAIVEMVQKAMPGILNLTNLVAGALTNVAALPNQVSGLLTEVRPVVSNLAVITGNITNPQGSLGDWLIPVKTKDQLDSVMDRAGAVMDHTDAKLDGIVSNLNASLVYLSGITSNLNAQVQANTNILKEISRIVVDADGLVEGLKRHWLLRSAFKTKPKSAPPKRK
jgi:ABC-type transporter Mla subunit MlaD